tara:strand:+ start:1114 stop:1224 length:111 start_codon:yes stop_codon:yes gene_type:complete
MGNGHEKFPEKKDIEPPPFQWKYRGEGIHRKEYING